MTITELQIDQMTTALRLEGNFVYTQRKLFQDAIRKACQQGARKIVLDLSAVPMLDSAALGLLMVTHRLLCNERRRLVLARPRPNIKQVIENAGLPEINPLSDGEELVALRKTA
jgi:anti-anti-sigma factor